MEVNVGAVALHGDELEVPPKVLCAGKSGVSKQERLSKSKGTSVLETGDGKTVTQSCHGRTNVERVQRLVKVLRVCGGIPTHSSGIFSD